MIDALAQLQQLRQQIRAAVDQLTAEADRESGALIAEACISLASECQQLDRLLALLSDEVLKQQPPQGTA